MVADHSSLVKVGLRPSICRARIRNEAVERGPLISARIILGALMCLRGVLGRLRLIRWFYSDAIFHEFSLFDHGLRDHRTPVDFWLKANLEWVKAV